MGSEETAGVQWVDLGDLTRVSNVDMHALRAVEDLLGDGWVLDDVLPDQCKASARWNGDGPPVIPPVGGPGVLAKAPVTQAGEGPMNTMDIDVLLLKAGVHAERLAGSSRPTLDAPVTTRHDDTVGVPVRSPAGAVKPTVKKSPGHVSPPCHDGPGGKTLAREEAMRRVAALTTGEVTVAQFLEAARDAWDAHVTSGGRGEYCWVRHVTLGMLAFAVTISLDDPKAASRLLRLYDTSCRPRQDSSRRRTGDLPLSRVVARCADRDLRMTRLAEACAVIASRGRETMPEPAFAVPFAWDGVTRARGTVVSFHTRELDPVLDAAMLRGLHWLSGADLARLHARGMRGAVGDPQKALTSLVSPARRERTVRVAACLHRGACWTPTMLAVATGLDASGFSAQFLYSMRNARLAKLARAHDGTLLVAGNPVGAEAWLALRKRLGIRAAEWKETVTGGGVPLAPSSPGAVPHELAVTQLGLAASAFGTWVPEPAAYLSVLAGVDTLYGGKKTPRLRCDGALIIYPGDPSREITVCFEVTSPSALRGDTARLAKKAGQYLRVMQAPDARPLIVVYVLLSQPHLVGNDNERAGEILAKGIGAGAGPRNRVLIAQWADVLQGLPAITGLGVDSVRQRNEDSLRLAGFHRTDGGEQKRGWVPRRLDRQVLHDAPDQVRDIPA